MAAERPQVRAVREPAPAKVNLFLHVVGRRADGYHRLDSLVAFTAFGDRVEARPAPRLSLTIDGPFAAGLPRDGRNLVLAAAERLRSASGARGAAIRLTKRLPVAAGIGGGSSDAAAALRALRRLWRLPPEFDLRPIAESLGADVPMCLARVPVRVGGAGERLRALADFPAMPLVLVNPGTPLATADVFRVRAGRFGAPAPAVRASSSCRAVLRGLRDTRNDLAAAATTLVPAIADVLQLLSDSEGCRLARMSGSGATCFGLFDDAAAAGAAARSLRRRRPDWWIRSTRLVRPTPPTRRR